MLGLCQRLSFMGQTTTLCNLSMAIRLSDSGWRLIGLPRRARILLLFTRRAAPCMDRFRVDGAIRCTRGMIPPGTSCKPIEKLTGWTMPGQEAARGSLFPILKGPTRVWPCTNSFSPTREDEGRHETPALRRFGFSVRILPGQGGCDTLRRLLYALTYDAGARDQRRYPIGFGRRTQRRKYTACGSVVGSQVPTRWEGHADPTCVARKGGREYRKVRIP